MSAHDRWIWLGAVAVAGLVAGLVAVGGSTVKDSIDRQSSTSSLDPRFRSKLAAMVAALQARGFKPWVYETKRTPARQAWLYASGRTRPGAIVTNVLEPTGKGHGPGRAADVIDGRAHPTRSGERIGWGTWQGKPGDDKAAEMAAAYFAAQGEEAEKLGLIWGGRWTLQGGGSDKPHVELA